MFKKWKSKSHWESAPFNLLALSSHLLTLFSYSFPQMMTDICQKCQIWQRYFQVFMKHFALIYNQIDQTVRSLLVFLGINLLPQQKVVPLMTIPTNESAAYISKGTKLYQFLQKIFHQQHLEESARSFIRTQVAFGSLY